MNELQTDLDRYGPFSLDNYWVCASEIEMQKGNFDAAVVHREKLVQLNPVFGYRRYLAQGYLGAGRIDDALKILEKIINRYELNRAYWSAFGVMTHYYLGQAYEESGWNDRAIEQYETFLDIWKNADSGLVAVEDTRERLARLKTAP